MGQQLVETIKLTSAASAIDIQNIPQDGTDLLIRMSLRTTNAAVNNPLVAYFNNDTNYYERIESYSSGSSQTASNNQTTGYLRATNAVSGANAATGYYAVSELYIYNYTASGLKEAMINYFNPVGTTVSYLGFGGYKTNTSVGAVTSFKVAYSGYNLAADSSISLYKITAD